MSHEHERLVIIRHAPYSSNALREGLDVALVAAAFGQTVSLLFLGQGVLALLKEQAAGAPGRWWPTIPYPNWYSVTPMS